MNTKTLFLFLLLAVGSVATRAEIARAESESSPTELESIRIFGGSREDLSQPLVPKKVSKEKIAAFQFTDVNRALKQTPGVYVREEEGQGLRPNIGLRGTNPDRSKKVVLMEDGVLIGPAPYSAPAAYYTPNMNHVESLEVFRGFTAVPFGPNSIGGAVNYLSPGIPDGPAAKGAVQMGKFGTKNLKVSGGATRGRWGGFVQGSLLESDGFKQLDGGGDTGFLRHDVATQFRFSLPSPSGRVNGLKVRLGYADEDSHETYLGLAGKDFFAKPYRRYSASALDRMRWRHTKVQAEHEWQLSDSALLRTTAYQHNFHRDWYRFDRFRGTNPVSVADVLRNPFGTNQPYYEVLTGAADSASLGGTNGQLTIANNDRTFLSQGIQTKYANGFDWGRTSHELEVGLRWHLDSIRRNHTYDYFTMEQGRLVYNAGAGRQQDAKNKDSANARTLSFQDNISIGRFVFTGVARYENVDFENRNELTSVTTKRNDDVFVPGVGALLKINDVLSTRVSVNEAVTLAGLDSSGRERREQATNYEAALKYFHPGLAQAADLVLFRNNYQNITGTCTASTGCAAGQLDLQFNGGAAEIWGLESQIAQGIGWGKVWIPLQLNATWIHGEFRNSFQSTGAEWGVGSVRKGDPLPYVPGVQYTFSVGLEYKKFKQEAAVVYQSRMFDQSVEAGRQEVPAYGVIDWSGSYRFGKAELFAKLDNVLGREYLVALKPFGARPGKPRSYMLGLSYEL